MAKMKAIEAAVLVLEKEGVTVTFGVPGAAEYSIPLYKRKQALEIRSQLFATFEDFVVNGQDRDLRDRW